MWFLPLHVMVFVVLGFLTVCVVYWLVLAAAYFLVKEPNETFITKLNRFAILVPAHDEELLISQLCKSLLRVSYAQELREVFIIADNCSDRTAEVCKSYSVNVLVREDQSRIGKGFAISWALGHIPLEQFDAVLMLDADNIVDPAILDELNRLISRGERVIQCNNAVGNRSDSWFTQLLFVARTIGNFLYHHSKYKLGLSSNLMGNGMCFTSALLQERGWTAFTIGEDWEYYARLIEHGIKIGFAVKAKVFHQESQSLAQATSQRLRWSSGKFTISKKLGFRLFFKGLRIRNWFTVDASLPLILPNWSLQINLVVIALLLSFFIPAVTLRTISMLWSMSLILAHIILFGVGVYLSGEYWNVFKAVLKAPLFLAWKLIIDFLSITGIYRGSRWIRTQRHISSKEITPGHP